jgi:two-component system NarL family sensor kinase
MLFLYQKKQSIFQNQLETIKDNYEKELLRSQLEMQEQTFQFISREIHDNIGQFISLAKLYLNTLDLNDRESTVEKVFQSTELLTKALDDLRDLSRSLSSELIQNAGLIKAIEIQVMQLQKTGKYHILMDIQGNYQYLDEQREIILFRILQESINNIVRHANAQEIIILLSYLTTHVKLYIQDNGNGFDSDINLPGYYKKNATSGIGNMLKRAKMIEAELSINSKRGGGTAICITVPYQTN